MSKLLTIQTAKLAKTQTDTVMSVILYLDPLYDAAICKSASTGCRKSCLINSGRMRMENAVNARRNRTTFLRESPELFMTQLKGELLQAYALATRQGKMLDVRLNGTSDLDWSEIYAEFPYIHFHEYTKRPELAQKLTTFKNVHVTFSKHEGHSIDDVKQMLFKGINVAVVFKKNVPDQYNGIDVIDGDAHDRRWEDATGQIVGLKLKGTNEVKDFAIRRGFAV